MGRRKTLSVFQAHLPFQSRVPRRTVAVSFAFERRALAVLAAVLVCSGVLYSYFIMLSVSHVVVREEIILESERLASEVSKLEQAYLARSLSITERDALAHGFARTNPHIFIERSTGSVGFIGDVDAE